MTRAIVALLMCAFFTLGANAQVCEGCVRAKEAQSRTGVAAGSPQPNKKCVKLIMSNPNDSVDVTIFYAKGEGKITYPSGQVKREGGSMGPMVCIGEDVLELAVKVQIVPGSQEACGVLYPKHIAELMKRGVRVLETPECLKRECIGKKT